jgi:hypothetical protein
MAGGYLVNIVHSFADMSRHLAGFGSKHLIKGRYALLITSMKALIFIMSWSL